MYILHNLQHWNVKSPFNAAKASRDGSVWPHDQSGVTDQVLLGVLPNNNSSTDVHIQRAYYTKLRYLNTVLKQVDEFNRYSLSLVPGGGRRNWFISNRIHE